MAIKTDQRKEYLGGSLDKKNAANCPIEQFKKWYEDALDSKIIEANAMNLATVDESGRPSSRIVLLREFSEKGFVFYTNYESQKGKEIAKNSKAAICFYWDALERQVRIQVNVEKISKEDSEKYFRNRPKDAQISAYISSQSAVIKNRTTLEQQHLEAEERFKNSEIPLPSNWGGYIAKPINFEFWQGRKGRLHDRLKYSKESVGQKNESWKIERLCP